MMTSPANVNVRSGSFTNNPLLKRELQYQRSIHIFRGVLMTLLKTMMDFFAKIKSGYKKGTKVEMG